MALSTYAELQTAIRNELDISTSGISDAAIVDAITRCEAKVCRKARLREMEQLAYATYSSGSRYLALPTGFLEMLNLKVKVATAADTTYAEAQYVAPFRLTDYYGSSADKWYFTLRDQIEFHKEPSADQTVMMHYLKRWDIATDSTNWLLTNFPDVYLYGSLMECELYVRDDQRAPAWKSLFEEGIADLNALDERGRDDALLDTSEAAGVTSNYYSYRSLING